MISVLSVLILQKTVQEKNVLKCQVDLFSQGVELRIFDHFNSFHLIDLIRILVYLAENSRVKECKKYIYNETSWKNTLRDIMKEGWNSSISEAYLNLLRTNLGLELNIKDGNAFDVLKELVNELFEKHKEGLYPTLMMEKKYTEPPVLPGVIDLLANIIQQTIWFQFLELLKKNIKKEKLLQK